MIKCLNITAMWFVAIVFCFSQPDSILTPSLDTGLPTLTNPTSWSTTQKEMDDYFGTGDNKPGYKQWERKKWFLEPRLYGLEDRSHNLMLKSYLEYENYTKNNTSRSTHGNWNFLGPYSCSVGLGRLNAVEIHPLNEDIIYVGAGNGGVWKTINGGTDWINISPHIPLLSIADIRLDPFNANTVYILTGDGAPIPAESNDHGQPEVSSIGILKSIDAGGTWQPTGFSFDIPSGIVPYKLLIDPTDSDIQFIVENGGIIRTDNDWDTWTEVISGNFFDIEFKPGDSDIMYATNFGQIFRSVDNGLTWTIVTDTDFVLLAGVSRIELAVTPDASSRVYAIGGNFAGTLFRCLRSNGSGADDTWEIMDQTNRTFDAQANYCIALEVDPADESRLFGGMQFMARSTNWGDAWTGIQNGPLHADIHDVAIRGDNIYVACDGGLYKSDDDGATWTDLSQGLAITEIYRIGGTAQNTDLYFMGTQDNGTMRRNGSTTNFDAAMGGDGMECYVDRFNTNIVYASFQRGIIRKSTQGGAPGTFSDIHRLPQGNWITPYLIDPNISSRIFIGKDSLYRSNNGGDSWVNLGYIGYFDGTNCIAKGPSDQGRIYVSSETRIRKTDDATISSGTASWENITAGLPFLFITDIKVDPSDSERVFITLSGYSSGDKVFMSTTGGSNSDWVNISGSLPNVPVSCIEYVGQGIDAMYIGTDIGVFYKDNNIGDWIYFSNNLPSVVVSDLYFNQANNTIVAGTYGRGLWRSSDYSTCISAVFLSGTTDNEGVRFTSVSDLILSNRTYEPTLGTNINYSAGSKIQLSPGFYAGGNARFHAEISGCSPEYSEFTIPPQMPNGRLTNLDKISSLKYEFKYKNERLRN